MKNLVINFRVSKDVKYKMQNKATALGVSPSKLFRLILEHDKVLQLDDSLLIAQANDASNGMYDAKISVRLLYSKYEVLKQQAIILNLNFSILMRVIIEHEMINVSNKSYIDQCLKFLHSIGVIINQIAHQLNLDNIKNIIGSISYDIALSRLKYVKFNLKNLVLFAQNPPDESNNGRINITNKLDTWKWISSISAVQNNIDQIAKRAHLDYLNNRINENQFKIIFDEVKYIVNDINMLRATIILNKGN